MDVAVRSGCTRQINANILLNNTAMLSFRGCDNSRILKIREALFLAHSKASKRSEEAAAMGVEKTDPQTL
jgi:hypothetical protein